MSRLLVLFGIALVVLGGTGSIAFGRQIDFEVESKLVLVLQAEPADGATVDPDLLAATARTIESRAGALGIEGTRVWIGDDDQIVVELPGVNGDRADEIGRSLTTTALLELIDTRGQFLN